MLYAVYGSHDGEPKDEDLAAAQAMLARIRDQEHWIACGCNEKEGRRPLLIPVRVPGSARVTLRRGEEGHLPHHPECPFFIDIADVLRLYERYDRSCRRPTGAPGFLAFHAAAPLIEDEEHVLDAGRQRDVGYECRPRLATRLFWLLDAAGVNRLVPSA
ncbi:hypothetical protein, partial [Paraburkholderia tropica]|uniref:hypothetical protein n=1 Tax=Paraburkholderia tropica TaxID=92647 RepID=UPI002AB6BC64